MPGDLGTETTSSAVPEQRASSEAVAGTTSIARPSPRRAVRVACVLPRTRIDLPDAIDVALARSHKVATIKVQMPLTTKALVNDVSSQWAASLVRCASYEQMRRLHRVFRDNGISILHVHLKDWERTPDDHELETSRLVLDAFVTGIDLDLIVLSGQERAVLVFDELSNRGYYTSFVRFDDATDWEEQLARHVDAAMARSDHVADRT